MSYLSEVCLTFAPGGREFQAEVYSPYGWKEVDCAWKREKRPLFLLLNGEQKVIMLNWWQIIPYFVDVRLDFIWSEDCRLGFILSEVGLYLIGHVTLTGQDFVLSVDYYFQPGCPLYIHFQSAWVLSVYVYEIPCEWFSQFILCHYIWIRILNISIIKFSNNFVFLKGLFGKHRLNSFQIFHQISWYSEEHTFLFARPVSIAGGTFVLVYYLIFHKHINLPLTLECLCLLYSEIAL